MVEEKVTLEELREQVGRVARCRRIAEQLKQERTRLMDEWTLVNKGLLDSYQSASSETAAQENKLREMTVRVYNDTGDKSPVEGVGIRELTILKYNVDEAFEWAMNHEMAIKLDVPVFEKIAKASPMDFVAIHKEPQATISTKLPDTGD